MVVVDASGKGLLEAEQQTHQGALAASRLAHNAHVFAGLDLQGQVVENQGAFVIVTERQAAHLDAAVELLHLRRLVLHLGNRLKHGLQTVHQRMDLRERRHLGEQQRQSGCHHAECSTKGDIIGV